MSTIDDTLDVRDTEPGRSGAFCEHGDMPAPRQAEGQAGVPQPPKLPAPSTAAAGYGAMEAQERAEGLAQEQGLVQAAETVGVATETTQPMPVQHAEPAGLPTAFKHPTEAGLDADSMQAPAAGANGAASKPKPAGSLADLIASPELIKAAEAQNVLWARVRGFPHWPAQIMSEKEALARLAGVKRAKASLPVMFFGTLEIAWIAPPDTASWGEGVAAKFFRKAKARKPFVHAVQQARTLHAYEFLTPGAVSGRKRRSPENWWCAAAPRPKQPKGRADEAEADMADAPQAQGPEPLQQGDAGLEDSRAAAAKRTAHAMKRADGADDAELDALLGRQEEVDADPEAGPAKRKASANGRRPGLDAAAGELRPPPYEQVRRNVWVSRQRPKRLPKDEIPVCSCRPDLPSAVVAPLPATPAATAPGERPQSSPAALVPPVSPLAAQPMPSPVAADPAANAALSVVAPPVFPPLEEPAPPQDFVARPGSAPPQLLLRPESAHAPEQAATQPQVEQPGAPLEGLDNGADRASEGAAGASSAPPDLVQASAEEGASSGEAAAQRTDAIAAAPPAPDEAARSRPMSAAPKLDPPERSGCGENCLNRLSYIHCDPRLCPCGERCSNRPFHLLPLPKMDLLLTDNRGWGVRAAEPIPKGAFIVEYAGEVVEESECRRRMAAAKENGQAHFYMMELAPGLIIDARSKGNLARFINSSCAPNCESQKWHDAATGEIRIGIFAGEDIAPGAELTYDYQFQHAGLAQDAGAYRCMCGAPNCRGTMDTQPERFRDFGKRVEVFWDGDSVFYRGTVTAYSAATRKHTILYDDNDVERVCLQSVQHRWLDESAPQKLSPLQAAMVQQNELLGPEPLSLDGTFAAADGAGDDDKKKPAPALDAPLAAVAAAVIGPGIISPMVDAPPVAAAEAAVEGAPDQDAKAPPPPAGRGRKALAQRGRKRKQIHEAPEEEPGADGGAVKQEAAPESAKEAPMGKHKMWLKRCQRENREQSAGHPEPAAPPTAPSAAQPAATAQPAAAPAQRQPPPHALFGDPAAMGGIPPGGMPPGAPDPGSAMQAVMLNMLMMGGQFMPQAALPPGMFPPGAFTQSGPAWDQAAAQQHMASLHAFLAQYAAASAAAAGGQGGAPPPHWPYAPGAAAPAGASLTLPPPAPLHLGPLVGVAGLPQQPQQQQRQQQHPARSGPPMWGPAGMLYAPPGGALLPAPGGMPAQQASRMPPPMWPHHATMPALSAAYSGPGSTAATPAASGGRSSAAPASASSADRGLLGLVGKLQPQATECKPPASQLGAPQTARPSNELQPSGSVDQPAQAGAGTAPVQHARQAADGSAAGEASGAPVPLAPLHAHAAAEESGHDGGQQPQASGQQTAPTPEAAPAEAAGSSAATLDSAAGAEAIEATPAPAKDPIIASAPAQQQGASQHPPQQTELAASVGAQLLNPLPEATKTSTATAAMPAEAGAGSDPGGATDAVPRPESQTQLAAQMGSALLSSSCQAAGRPVNMDAEAEAASASRHLAVREGLEELAPHMPNQAAPGAEATATALESSAGAAVVELLATGAAQNIKHSPDQPQSTPMPPPSPPQKASPRLIDPTAHLGSNGVSSGPNCVGGAHYGITGPPIAGNGAPAVMRTPPPKLVDPVRLGALSVPDLALPAAAAEPGSPVQDADEAELWGSLLVDSPSPCKLPAKAAWGSKPPANA